MALPVLICEVHGDQGHRLMCKWCSRSIFDSLRSRSSSLEASDVSGGAGNSASPNLLKRESLPLDAAQDQYQDFGDGLP